MKNSWVFALCSCLPALACTNHAGPDNAQQAKPMSISISAKGSDTELPLSHRLAESFMKAQPDAAITVVGGGSGTGITSLLNGTTDICMSSRELKMNEQLKFAENNRAVKQVIIAYDALSVVVHPSNPVNQLTREQLEQIFTGVITNWKSVGGKDARIVVISRESSSGTYEYFKEYVLGQKNYAPSVLNLPATGAIVQSVSQTEGAIGYIGLAYSTPTIKSLKISFDQGKTFVAPSMANVKNNTYPLARPLLYFYEAKSAAKVNAFVEYVLSAAGQQNVADIGYVPINY